MDAAREAALVARIADLEATVADLRRRHEAVYDWPFLPLQPMQMRLLSALYAVAPAVATVAALETALYGAHGRGESALRQHVSFLRAALAGTDVEIVTHRGLGWSLPIGGQTRLMLMRETHEARVA